MFSATVPAQIGKMAAKYQRDAMRIATAGEKKQHADIEYRLMPVAPHERENAIINALLYFDAPSTMVFLLDTRCGETPGKPPRQPWLRCRLTLRRALAGRADQCTSVDARWPRPCLRGNRRCGTRH